MNKNVEVKNKTDIKTAVDKLISEIKNTQDKIYKLEDMVDKRKEKIEELKQSIWKLQEKCNHVFPQHTAQRISMMGRGICVICGWDDY